MEKDIYENYLILDILEKIKQDNNLKIRKEELEQYFTTPITADFMANMFTAINNKEMKIMDPGSGIGILTFALVKNICAWENKPNKITVVAYEIDINLIKYLKDILEYCKHICLKVNIEFKYKIINDDFIKCTAASKHNINNELFDFIIMNPPYKKINRDSEVNNKLLDINVDVPNYYAAFVLIGTRYLKDNGQLVAITPRSFCNGAYFEKFRNHMLENTKFKNIHLFESRDSVFKQDNVLQETIIYKCIKEKNKRGDKILVSYSNDDSFSDIKENNIKVEDVVYPGDEQKVIHILTNKEEKRICGQMRAMPCTLEDLKIQVSTGPIVDFRVKDGLLSKDRVNNALPVIFSEHVNKNQIKWPLSNIKKYNYIVKDSSISNLLRPRGNYVLVKRMTSKEETRRIIASLCYENDFEYNFIAYDNKLNYYHSNKKGLELDVAKGLCVYLNLQFVDTYFRTISGSTQVNVRDLKNIKYPKLSTLRALSKYFADDSINENDILDIIRQDI